MTDLNLCWDLDALYPDVEAWEKDFARITELGEKFASFKGRLHESASVLRQAIEASDEFERLCEKVYSYAHLKSDENTSININRSRVDRVKSKFAQLSALDAWFDPELMAIDDKTMQAFLDDPELAFYRRSLEELLREKPHTLSEKEELLLGTLSDVMCSADNTFGILNDADLDFGKIRDNKGKSIALTHGNYRRFMEHPDRETRKRAFRKMYLAYGKLRNTFASTLDAAVKRHVTSARIRHYDSALGASLAGDNVPESVYRNLIAAVHDKFDGIYDYMKLRREVMGLEKLDMFDMYNPLLPGCTEEYSFADAEKMVRNALVPLGGDYAEKLALAFSQRWIDAVPRKGKRSGAYSGGCFDSYPYILMSFDGTLNDVFTLAHELGHSMHTYYSKTHQAYHYADYEIFVAEVASTTNEILLSEYLLENTQDSAFRACLLGHLADEIRATIYRQTMFAEFELKMHEASAQDIPLTADWLCDEYYQLNKLYHGDEVAPDQRIELEWARIPHFYYNFYVYKYATGMSAALKLAANLRSQDPAKREAYFGFLKAGDSKDVLDIMRDAGVDLSSPAPVRDALDYFADVVKRLRRELGK